MGSPGRLIFFCGKMAAGKSTLARKLTDELGGVLLSQDALLDALYPGEILEITDYARCSRRLCDALFSPIVELLKSGSTVVMDFPGNTPTQRAWFRSIIDASGADHRLYFLDVSDETCKAQLRERTAHLPPGSPWTTDAEFDAVTAYFQPPAESEEFVVVRV